MNKRTEPARAHPGEDQAAEAGGHERSASGLRERPGSWLAAPDLKVPELAGSLAGSIGEFAERPLVVRADVTVGEAAQAMRDAGASAALVGDEPSGIVTDSDLRRRVVAAGRPATTPVEAVMTRPLHSLEADTPLYGALLSMLRQGVHHVAVTEGGRLVGVVSEREVLRRQVRTPLLLLARIESIDRPEALEGYAAGIAATAEALLAGGLDPVRIARVIASLNDALTRRLLDLAEAELGPPPCPYAWLVLGSEGRMEQVLLSDQDNALVYRDDGDDAHEYFARLAERVVGGLLRAGYPECPGGYMATNWRRPLAAWRDTFRDWVEAPEPQALLEAEVFLDFRPVHGGLSPHALDEILLEAGGRELFLGQLARVATRFPPPLRRLGRLRAEEGQVDLKQGGIAAIVLLARLYALVARSTARPTLERLELAGAAGALSSEAADELAEAFRLLMRLRLREQLRMLAEGRAPENRVPLAALSPLERGWLRDALGAVSRIQKATAMRFQTEGIA